MNDNAAMALEGSWSEEVGGRARQEPVVGARGWQRHASSTSGEQRESIYFYCALLSQLTSWIKQTPLQGGIVKVGGNANLSFKSGESGHCAPGLLL